MIFVFRMKTRCIDLEMGNEEFQKKYEQLDEDRADVIAYLKKIVQEREDEITGLKQLIDGLQKAVQEEIRNNKEVVESHEHEFKMMYEQLTSEIKLLTGKLNSLEEFRTQRDDIMKKFKVQEAEMDEQEERHRTVQYEVEKKSIIGKDRLKKDIEARLAQLCADFQDAAHIRIAATTHQAIRENITVNNELEKMLGALRAVTKKNDFLKERDRKMELEFQLRKEEKDIVTSKSMAQLKLINRLSSEHEEMVRHLGELQNSAQRGKDLEQLVVETRAHLDRAVQHIAKLEDRVKTTERDKDETNTMLVKSDVEIYNLQKVLSAAVVSVKNAIEVREKHFSFVLSVRHEGNPCDCV
ncbi:hypothetical protein ANN_10527 [Periplaneta americana]|uniref:Cilia- and flagella-associated protein 157 n=1 Tax=Periplaneta americana TaxID=6978 RepID=A0ABQ8TP86_PERAM|nr:hypothetical protein ANN_10527 [Periplaneta americana]